MSYYLSKVMWIVVVFILVYYNTPLKSTLTDVFHVPEITESHALVILVPILCWYTAEILGRLDRMIQNQTKEYMISQEEIIPHAFSKLRRNDSQVDILIYTSYSIFHQFDHLIQTYPQLGKAKIRILLKDPDEKMLINQGSTSPSRMNQLQVALSELALKQKEQSIEVRFYRNEPWVRGINVDHTHLFYSTYGGKEETFDVDVEYSGSKTPWIELRSDQNKENQFISSFTALFDIIWNECTNYKNVILDLQGTIFADATLSSIFQKAPLDYITSEFPSFQDKMINEYEKLLMEGMASTEAVAMAVCKCTRKGYKQALTDYLLWKESNVDLSAVTLPPMNELIDILNEVSKTYKLYILTNHISTHTEVILKKLDLYDCFATNHIISADMTQLIKPNVRLKEYLRNQHSLNLNETIFIGDRTKVDLDYVKQEAMGLVLLKNPSELGSFLENLTLSYTYAKKQAYQNIEIIK